MGGDRTASASAVHWSGPVDPGLHQRADDLARQFPASGIAAQDLIGALVGASERAALMLGLSVDQMLGRTSMDPRWAAVSEKGLPLVGREHPAMVTLATGEPVTGFLMGVMTPVDVGDLGRTVARTRWIDIDTYPALVPGSQESLDALVGVVAVFDDVTESARGRAASDVQWATLNLVLQNTEDVLVRTSAEGVVHWVSLSSNRVLGWHPGDMVGLTLEELAHPDDRSLLADLRARIRADQDDQRVTRAELRVRTPNGTWRWMSDAARMLRDRELHDAGEVHALRDIEAEILARQALEQSEQHYRLIAENASDVILHVRSGRVAWISPSVTIALGGQQEQWIGRDVLDHIAPEDRDLVLGTRERLAHRHSTVVRVRVIGADEAAHWVDAHVRQYQGSDGSPDGYIASLRVVDDVVRAEAALERQARIDALTGLANRAEAMRAISGVVRDERRAGKETAVLFCDLDHLKEVNDELGHLAGDEVLRIISDRVRSSLRQDDFVARIGGDEILVIVRGLVGLAEAQAVAEKVRLAVCEPVAAPTGIARVSVSIGVTLVAPGDTGDSLVERADSAMYEAKRTGRNQVVARTA